MRRLPWKDATGSLIAALFSLPAWAYPLGNDQALHWYVGRRWLEGELPFVSAISSKPIVIFLIHAFSIAVFGANEWALRVVETLSVVLTGWLVAVATTPRGVPREDGLLGLGALVFAGLYYTFYDYWDVGHPELWEAAFVVLGLAIAVHAPSPWLRDAGAGAAGMAAFMTKFPAALPVLAISGVCALRAVRERSEGLHWMLAIVFAAARFVVGMLVIVGLCILPFAIGGKLGPMWEILYEFMIGYVQKAHYRDTLPTWLRIEHGGGLLIATFVLSAAAFGRLFERRDREGLERLGVLVAITLLGWASVTAQGWYFDYHWMVLGPPLAMLLVFSVRTFSNAPQRGSWLQMLAVCAAVCAAVWVGPRWLSAGSKHTYGKHIAALVDYRLGVINRDQFLAPFRGRGRLDARATIEATARIVRSQASPGDTLCVRGFSTPLYVITDMRCTSRHVVEMIVRDGLPAWPREYANTMRSDPPTFVVTFLDRKRDVKELEEQGYRRVGAQGLYGVFSRKPAATPGS